MTALYVQCPVCSASLPASHIHAHLDQCLGPPPPARSTQAAVPPTAATAAIAVQPARVTTANEPIDLSLDDLSEPPTAQAIAIGEAELEAEAQAGLEAEPATGQADDGRGRGVVERGGRAASWGARGGGGEPAEPALTAPTQQDVDSLLIRVVGRKFQVRTPSSRSKTPHPAVFERLWCGCCLRSSSDQQPPDDDLTRRPTAMQKVANRVRVWHGATETGL
jgi:hypothetical protein